jgi:hypothetical protein
MVQVTAVLEAPVTEALNCCRPLGPRLIVVGEIVTMVETGTVTATVTLAVADPAALVAVSV